MLCAVFPLPGLGRAQGLAAPGHHSGTGRVAHNLLLGWRGQGHVGGHGALKALVGVKADWEREAKGRRKWSQFVALESSQSSVTLQTCTGMAVNPSDLHHGTI